VRYYVVDDDPGVRAVLADIIEDEDLGEIVGEAEDGAQIDEHILEIKKVDILLIDLLMPLRDGIETIRQIGSAFTGKTVMLSQVESKELVGEAYSLGIEYYVTKPLNRLEVVSVLQKVRERLILEKSIHDIQVSLNVVTGGTFPRKENPYKEKSIVVSGNFLLSELGILGESGSKDLLNILEYLFNYEKAVELANTFPTLRKIFEDISKNKLGPKSTVAEIAKEVKASEQRIRRAIYQALIHITSLGLTDYSNPKFENYAAKFFDFAQVRKTMLDLENDMDPGVCHARINTKKFIQVLYWEAKILMG
jgi:two-component system, response regulator YcbB